MRYVAFLRAINVGGHIVKMDALRARFEDLGLANVETFIASGNVIFDARSKDTASLERRIEKSLEAALGYEVATFIRTLADVSEIASYEPFPKAAMATAAALNVGLLKGPIEELARPLVEAFTTDIDAFHVNGNEIYWMCHGKQMESKFSNAVFERKLKMRATFRGLRTMQKLAAKYPP